MAAEILMIVGRVAFGGFFLIAGLRNMLNFGDRRANAVTNYGWGLPAPLLAVGFGMQIVGGVLVILNAWAIAGALVLIAFLLAATPLYHNPFMFQGKEREPHIYLTLVNVTLCGGLLMVIADRL